MKSFLLPLLAISLALLLLAHSSCLPLGGGRRGGYGRMSPLALLHLLATEQERGDTLDDRRAAMRRCTAGKARATRDLIEGRRTLLEAAAVFRELQEAVPGYVLEGFRREHRGDSDDERFCRAVIRHVAYALADGPQADLVKRLEKELESHRQRGTLRSRFKKGSGAVIVGPPAPF